MTKRSHEDDEAPQARWYVRLAWLKPADAPNRYGARVSIATTADLNLAEYSLVIPAFTTRHDIPSSEAEQRALPWLWNVYEHVRYFGVLDLDMALGAVLTGAAPLFSDTPAHAYASKGEIKQAFAARLLQQGFGAMVALCPPFAQLYHDVLALVTMLQAKSLGFFSGGGGFRVLFTSPLAWRRVVWGQAYAQAYHTTEFPLLLRQLAPGLPDEVRARLVSYSDKNVHDSDKGVKPDLLAHFDTHIFPCPLDATFLTRQASRAAADVGLSAAIRAFWRHIFDTVPRDAPRLVASITKPPLVAYAHALYRFPKCKKQEATHMVLQGDVTSYRRVDDPEVLYAMLRQQWREHVPINAHEIRTPVTRRAIDYDGGPDLRVPLQRADTGQWETPLHAIQEIHRTCVFANGTGVPGLVLACLPRPREVVCRAHLVWPDWPIQLGDEAKVNHVLEAAMHARWPTPDWHKILDSPARLRMFLSDTWDKERGVMAQRPMHFGTAFDGAGEPVDVSTVWPQVAGPDLNLELLRLCSLRGTQWQPLALAPSVVAIVAPALQRTGKAAAVALAPGVRDAMMAVFERALADVKHRHAKPGAQLYTADCLHVSMAHRTVTLGVLNHQQCTATTTHGDNNVKLLVHMDRNAWELRCFRPGCPQTTRADPAWGQGVVDTTALRPPRTLPPFRHVMPDWKD